MSGAELSSIRAIMTPGESQLARDYISRVAELRKRRRLTQEEMADALNIPLERYKKYERRSAMPVYLIERFAAIVGSDVDYLVTGKSNSRRRGPRPEPAA